MRNIITYAFFKRKTTSLSNSLSNLEIVGVEIQIKHAGRDFYQSSHMHFDRALCQKGRGSEAVNPGLRYMVVPAAPYPPYPHFLLSVSFSLSS